MYPGSLPKPFIDSLYKTADHLEIRWSSARLEPDFRDRMIDAVIRFVQRYNIEDLSPENAKSLLTSFWKRNGIRDAGRAHSKPQAYSTGDVTLASIPEEDSGCNRLIEACRQLLVEAGERPMVAEAFLQSALNDKPSDVLYAIFAECGEAPNPDTIRQWRIRYFERIRTLLSSKAEALGLTPVTL
jgi:hypothetical protein